MRKGQRISVLNFHSDARAGIVGHPHFNTKLLEQKQNYLIMQPTTKQQNTTPFEQFQMLIGKSYKQGQNLYTEHRCSSSVLLVGFVFLNIYFSV
jgi:hypothetical protein